MTLLVTHLREVVVVKSKTRTSSIDSDIGKAIKKPFSFSYRMRFFTRIYLIVLLCHFALAEQLRSRQTWANETRVDFRQEESRQAQAVPDVDALIGSFQQARSRLVERLKVDYGAENYDKIFVDQHPNVTDSQTTIGRNAFYKGTSNAAVAWERTKRKMMIRILKHMIEGKVEDYVWATA